VLVTALNPWVPRPLLLTHSLWPSKDAPEPWQGVIKQLYGHLPGKRLLWTAAGGGWLTAAEALFPDAACLQQPQERNGMQASPESNSSSSSLGPLGEALLRLGLPLATLPPGVLQMMLKHLVRLCCFL
jgi:hypothetical protein